MSNPSQTSYGHGQRYSYHRSSSSDPTSASSINSSPMGLPPLLPSDLSSHDDSSPASSTSSTTSEIMTPDVMEMSEKDQAKLLTTPKMSSDHSVLSSMSQQPTPKLIIPFQGSTSTSTSNSAGSRFPLLPPHNPLRSKMYSIPEYTSPNPIASPAHTPKGHPLEKNRSNSGYFAYDAKTKTHPITNPYGTGNPSYSTTLSYLLRIPRRLRPVLLIGVCVFTFGLVLLNRAMSQANHMDHLIKQQRDLAFSRRYVDQHDKSGQHPLMANEIDDARSAEAAVQSTVVVGKSLEFESVQEEFAALISFVTSTTANALPSLDPSKPIDPHTVLDFDPTHPNAREDLLLLQNEINNMYPLVLIGKMRDPYHREIQRILSEYRISPAPLIIDVDQRRDHQIFVPLLSRLLSTSEEDLPQLVLKGNSLGSYHDILNLRDRGELKEIFESSGSIQIREIQKKKRKGLKEKERIENERILKPAPIVPY